MAAARAAPVFRQQPAAGDACFSSMSSYFSRGGVSISSNASSIFSPGGQLEYLFGDGPSPFAAPDGGAASASAATTAHACTGRGAERAQRIAFRTRSAIEILDDGYKWRKYGRKAVKNSRNPRNYYRCSTEACDVKKRVERDRDDSAYVVTTYEGTHSHASPSTVSYASHDAASGRFFIAGTHPHLDELAVIVTSDH